jgi:leucyl-tRNA synthetase
MPRYTPSTIEPKWQEYWESHRTFKTPDMPGEQKMYVLDMFPYPSGDGLHVGHPEGYTATDIVSRFQRMRGVTVLHPMGFDAFGLPAEEHAIKTNTPPRIKTEENIAEFTRQLKMLGFSYDWDRVVSTTDTTYFKWTQWIFLQLFHCWYDSGQQKARPIESLPIPEAVAAEGKAAVSKYQDRHRLAYQDDALVNWCPGLGTVLANEEVKDGKSDRGDHPVKRIPLRQWMLRITAYGDRLLDDLEGLDWSPSIKKLQSDWIGRSTGAEVDFFVGQAESEAYRGWLKRRAEAGWPETNSQATHSLRGPSSSSDSEGSPDGPARDLELRVYTTRPDTLYGATYMVIAPEHPMVERLTTDDQRETVTAYREAASFKSDRERTENDKNKTGVFSGSYAVNPVSGAQVPIWIADYVLAGYGTGAIMAVPGHDDRDFEFARAFDLRILCVVDPGKKYSGDRAAVLEGTECFAGKGVAVNSGSLDGSKTDEAKSKIIGELSEQGVAQTAVNFKLRDWLFSRQRFWGEPFPVLHELDDAGNPTGILRAVDAADLPVDLPHLEDYQPHGRPEPPLAKAEDEWLYVTIDGTRYRRETNTMPQWAGSCWYFLRFIDTENDTVFVDPIKEAAWMPVDLYVGGAEHAVLHLLYARFWHKVLYDLGHVSHREPFQRLVNQGMILGEMEFTGLVDEAGQPVSLIDGKQNDAGDWVHKKTQQPLLAKSIAEADVAKNGEVFGLASDPSIRVDSRSFKMSKSRGNVVNPDEIVRDQGADALRLYEMFMGPLEATKPWVTTGVSGVRGFLDRAWRLVVDDQAEALKVSSAVVECELTEAQARMLHCTIKAVSQDYESMGFNTAIARLMEFVNFFTKEKTRPKSALESFVLLLSPMAPHIAEELWQILGHDSTLAYEPWPEFDEALTRSSEVEVPLQINGKVKAKVQVAADADKATLEAAARAHPKIAELVGGKSIVKAIVVPGRMVNFVVK